MESVRKYNFRDQPGQASGATHEQNEHWKCVMNRTGQTAQGLNPKFQSAQSSQMNLSPKLCHMEAAAPLEPARPVSNWHSK
eukprot:1147844-Pelagomonas_calceolata.AAC.10